MGYRVKLATAGIAGVTRLTASVLGPANNNAVVSVNSVNVLTGSSAFEIMLPDQPVESGTIVEFKNLLDRVDPMMDTTATVTINRNGANLDQIGSNITTETRNEVFKLIYINQTIGWLVI